MHKFVLTFILYLFCFSAYSQVSLYLDTEKCEKDGKFSDFYKTDSLIFFCSQTTNYGYELWSTDGLEGNTNIVKDITVGIENTNFIQIKPFKKKVYFLIKNSSGIHELWESKGDLISTKKLFQFDNSENEINEIFPTDSSIILSTNVNLNLNTGNLLRFNFNSNTLTVIQNGISPHGFISTRDTLFFSGYNPVSGREIWYSLGDSITTEIYYDRLMGPNSGIQNGVSLCKLDSNIYFLYNNLIYKVDKNAVNTYYVTGLTNSGNLNTFESNGKYFFKLRSRVSSFFNYFNSIFELNINSLVFRMSSEKEMEVFYGSSNNKYYFIYEKTINVFDPVNNSTSQILNLTNEKIVFPIIKSTSSYLIFLTKNNDNQRTRFQLKRLNLLDYDLSLLKTYEYFDTQENYVYYYSFLTKAEDIVNKSVFFVNDGLNGLEPHFVNLNNYTTDILKNTNLSISNLSTSFNSIIKYKNKLIFSKRGHVGSPAVNYDNLSSSLNPQTNVLSTISGDYIENDNFFNNRIYFGNGQFSDTSLTYLENNKLGIRPVTINPKKNILIGSILTTSNNSEIGAFDGNQSFLIRDINGTSKSSSPSHFFSNDSLTFFTADSNGIGRELFITNGTNSGTKLVKDIINGSQGIDIRYAFIFKNEFYFEIYTSSGYQVWKSNGTEAGTFCFSCQFGMKEYKAHFIEKDSLFIFFNSPTFTLFRSDGTFNNTYKIKGDYRFVASPQLIINDGKVVFLAGTSNGINSTLYEIENDSAKVIKAKNNVSIYAKAIVSIDSRRILLIRRNYFSTDNFDEPYVFNSKTKEYSQLAEIYPGLTGSGIINFFKFSDKILFFANHPIYGREVWQYKIPTCPSEVEIGGSINTDYELKALYTINSTSIIQNSRVNFQAAENIVLRPGFSVDTGGIFKAEILGCD